MAGRKFYITENSLHMIMENLGRTRLPSFLEKAVLSDKTSLGKNEAIPRYQEDQFLLRLLRLRYENVLSEAEKYFPGIQDKTREHLTQVLTKMINDCQKKEAPIRTNLEKACFNYVVETLSVPEGYVSFTPELMGEIPARDADEKDMIEDDADLIFEDEEDMENLNKEVYKFRFLNCLIMGGAMDLFNIFLRSEEKMEEIAKLDPSLPELYKKIDVLNNYIWFISKTSDYAKTSPSGISGLVLGTDVDKTEIHSKGNILNSLMIESFRGFFKLFISHGLPDDPDKAEFIDLKTDFYEAELWDMRLGPNLFSTIFFLKDLDYDWFPIMLKEISSLRPSDFNHFMRNALAKTKKGNQMVLSLGEMAKDTKEREAFNDEMDAKRVELGVIEDDCFSADEL